ncbi:MAG: hypothetical protein LBP82_02320 [Candidatus Methanoplasma sp.]|jgi:hypothetical protein|nr:hypothetical protein [Candidatus Methanoplasma sp.]
MVDNKARTMIFALIVLMSAVIGIVGVFMVWLDFGVPTYTGWEFFMKTLNGTSFGGLSDSYPAYMPMLVLMFSLSGAISGLVAAIRPGRANGPGTMLNGIVVAIASIVFIWYFSNNFTSEVLGTGVYIGAAAGVLMLLFGALMTFLKTGNR